ncbi:MAG TPA: molybdopterin-guanine dinucleotide biosynthesis protein B [Thermodesulfobacteriota bacterium]|jgi:molybdopterin-guanine dinucleotide biosynthesis protein B|nr:molybdopterin-guanine dinucleotide biosynthesis protein B [Thermodesulfobacteriota bacterium]
MIPIISIVGKSDSGKTTLIEKLVPELSQRGYRVATVKHDMHGFEVDREGKDSWRHKQAGAHTVVISSPQKLALIRDVEKDLTLGEIRGKWIQDVDLILSEGYKRDVQPKIEIFRKEKHKKLLCTKKDNLIAIVSNQKFRVGVPCFDLEDMRGLANFIEKEVLKSKKEKEIFLRVDGRPISMTPFVKDFLTKTIKGMVSSLRGCETPEQIEIHIEEREKGQ